MPALATVEAGNSQALADALRDHGACLLQNFPPPPATTALRAELLALRDAGLLRAAAIGRESSRAQREDIRGDRTLWLDDPRCGEAAAAHLQALDALRTQLNRSLFLGLRSLEAHYALYPPGAGYARHRDRFRDDDARVVSLVSYLNENWHASDGGALRLHATDGNVDVLPYGETTVCFLSEIEHEVLPATRGRMSIAAWFRRDGPR
jgi:SM-20-related protein